VCSYFNEWDCELRTAFVTSPESTARIESSDVLDRISRTIRWAADGRIERLPRFRDIQVLSIQKTPFSRE